ncbi:MFS transporter [Archangium violaceum]|uniref:MFS transporter n=1 Tax=Archangium violaceum TaxID=83451 RepID=UPI00194E3637|nr:MFS transporter [Archangium violaceum]QRO01487.1 MFS transporter [Archangium violaceum]
MATGFQAFFILWIGQWLSLLGSRLSRFALGVWLFQRTGAVADYALMAACDMVPTLVLTPFTGVLADRYDRRTVMLLADTGAALGMLVAVGLVLAGRFEPWHLYLAIVVSASAGALHSPAWSAATALIVPRAQLGRAVGLTQVGEGVADIVVPSLAGVLLVSTGIMGALVVDFTSFLAGISVLLAFRFPPVPRVAGEAPVRSVWGEVAEAWAYTAARPALVGLLVLFGFVILALCAVQVLVMPMLLARASPEAMGLVLSVSGVGALCGSVAMSVWGGPRRRVDGMLGGGAVVGLGLVVGGAVPSLLAMAVVGFVIMFCAPVVLVCHAAIWQTRVPAELQGRAFSLRRVLGACISVVTYLSVGPLVDRVLEPLLLPGGALVESVGRVIGVGQGRGSGLLFIIIGVVLVLMMALGRASRLIHNIEDALEPGAAPVPSA